MTRTLTDAFAPTAGRVYYPMCRVVLSVVFDGVNDEGKTNEMVHERASDAGISGALLGYGGVPVSRAGFAGRPVVVRDVVPYEATVELNSYHEADSWELSFDSNRLPFHPDFIRSLQAEIYFYQRTDLTDDALSPDRRFADNFEREAGKQLELTSLAIVGLADEETFELSDDGRTFTCSGLDFTALLTAEEWDTSDLVAPGRKLDVVVQELIDGATQASTFGQVIKAKWEPYQPKAPVPVISGDGTNAKGLTFADGKNTWDVIYELCLLHGVICYVRGFEVVITTPQDQMDRAGVERRNEALRNRARTSGVSQALQGTSANPTVRVRRVAYGRNLETLTIKRNVGAEKTPQVVVKSYDPVSRAVSVGVYPEDGRSASKSKVSRRTSKKGTGERVTEEQELHVVHGVSSGAVLRQIAETIYNHKSRGESEIEFETKDLTDLAGADMLKLRPGDPVLIEFDPFGDDEMTRMGGGQRYAHLRSLGFSEEIAGFVAREYDRLDHFKRPYYTRNVRFEWDHEDGLGIGVTAVNFMRFPREKARAA